MDGLEITCPVDVFLPAKLMGSEGCGGVRVSSNKAGNNCDKGRVSIGVSSSIERCSVSISKKGELILMLLLLIDLVFFRCILTFEFNLGLLSLNRILGLMDRLIRYMLIRFRDRL